jgi:hypothetical protein
MKGKEDAASGEDKAASGGDKAGPGEAKAAPGKDEGASGKGKDKDKGASGKDKGKDKGASGKDKGKDKAASGKGKDKKDKQGKKGASDTSAAAGGGICIADHPRSASGVRRAKGLGGLLGAALAMILAHGAGLPLFDVLLRGLAGGIVGQLVLWAVAVAVARQLVIAEVRARYAEVTRAAAARAADSAA